MRKRADPKLNPATAVNTSREDCRIPEMSCEPSSESRSSEVIVNTGVCGLRAAEVSGATGAMVVSDCAHAVETSSIKAKGSDLFIRPGEAFSLGCAPSLAVAEAATGPPISDPAAVGLSRARQK